MLPSIVKSAPNPLASLRKLSPSVYLYEPPKTRDAPVAHTRVTHVTSSSAPKLIILVTWMSANPLHISKYVLGYQSRYPSSRILLIGSSIPDLFYRSTQTQRLRITPAVSAIISLSTAITNADPEILLHVFSNGGSHQTRNLCLAYSETTSHPFPPHVTIFDSCPGRATFQRSVLALSASLPSVQPLRLLLLLLIYVVISVYWIIFIPLGIPDPVERIRRALNDEVMMQNERSRCYIYSEADLMVGWDDVEAHARDAAAKGLVVRTAKFHESGHCAHVRVGGGDRYWAIIAKMWRGAEEYQDL